MPGNAADIAVLSPYSTPLYVDAREATGGAELQMFYLARSLAAAGFSVAHIVFDDAGLPAVRDGVMLARLPPRVPPPGIPRATRELLQALTRLRPKLIIQRNAGFDTGVAGMFARSTNRRFVYSSSSSADFTLAALRERKTRVAYQLGLRLADRVIVQSYDQQRLAALHGLDSLVIRSFCESAPVTVDAGRDYFLWIGGLNDYKRPMAYLDLAARIPEAKFLMVSTDRGPRWQGLAGEVRARAIQLPNCELLPACPRPELLQLYHRAVAVVNTSTFEGFPNTFMEGWARGAPALSLDVDPDGLVAGFDLGVVADGSMDAFEHGARTLWNRERPDNARQLRDYIIEHHSPHVVGSYWSDMVAGLLRRGA